ncbi:MAG: dTDP-4-amino-4,6-dideoxygalactose transaminase [Spirochaetaceae bacterium]
MFIPFNKPYLAGKELYNIEQSVLTGHISGNGKYTNKCQEFFKDRYSFNKTLLTTSCTDALEMCALLLDIKPGDEVIIPSYTFVSTALAFVREGAIIKFADSRKDRPGIDEETIEELITEKTKAIVIVHYAGIACDMDKIMEIANRNEIFVIEDAAQAIDGKYKNKSLGGIGHLGTFSFHETKNIQCGEGGLLIINDDRFIKRAEILWEKGTNRAEFFRGEINKYGWVDTGSSFLPSEIVAAFLFAQLEEIENIQQTRINIWNKYYESLKVFDGKGVIELPIIPDFSTNNAHMFYLTFNSNNQRTEFISRLKERNISTVFHYISLHSSEYYNSKHDGRKLIESDRYTDTLVRLPLYYELFENGLEGLIEEIKDVLSSF